MCDGLKLYVFNPQEQWSTTGACLVVASSKEIAARFYRERFSEYEKLDVDEYDIVSGAIFEAMGYDYTSMNVVSDGRSD